MGGQPLRDVRDATYRYIEECASRGEVVVAKDMLRDLIHRELVPKDLAYRTYLRYLVRFDLIPTSTRQMRHVRPAIRLRTLRMRRDYVKRLEENRALPADKRFVVVYQDESYVHQHHQRRVSWGNESAPDTLRPRSNMKGRRYCFSAAITEFGLLRNSLWLFCPQNTSKDYHRSFNADNFLRYFEGTMETPECDEHVGMMAQFEAQFPGRKALFVLDNAAYHKVYAGAPTSKSRKDVMVNYLQQHGVAGAPEAQKPQVYVKCVKCKEKVGCTVELLARARGHDVLFLPPNYSRWNPIEYYWAAAKRRVAEQYRFGRTVEETKQQLVEALQQYGQPVHCVKMIDSANQDVVETMALAAQAEQLDGEVIVDVSAVAPSISDDEVESDDQDE